MKKAVILGHTGFIGKAVDRALRDRGFGVVGHSTSTVDLRRAESLEALTPDAKDDAALVFVAALAPRKGRTAATLADNVAMVCNVAKFVEAHPFGLLVYVSSDAVYPFGTAPITEASPIEAGDYYAAAKLTGEKILDVTARTKGFKLLTVRPTAVYGPGDPNNSYGPNRFSRTLVKERAIQISGQGEETRDHIYIDDVARLMAGLIEKDATGVYNLATGTSRSFGDVVATFKSFVPFEFAVKSNPRTGAITHRSFDVAKLRAALPDFRSTDFAQGLRETYEHFSKAGA